MYEISYTKRFLAAAKRFKKEGKDMTLLWDAVRILIDDGCCQTLIHLTCFMKNMQVIGSAI